MEEADGSRGDPPQAAGAAFRRSILLGVALAALFAALYWGLREAGAWEIISNREALETWVDGLGVLGPLAIVTLMIVAVVFSPLPSAPIALAAGAAYGHAWGTVYVLAGAEIGAIVAFVIARLVGYEFVRRWFGDRISFGFLGSQNAMMGMVLISRMIPFLSFDLVSYAAGLTPLTTLRFAVATLAGILPASFLLAHFGGELVTDDPARIGTAVLTLGALTSVPLVIGLLRHRRQRPTAPECDNTKNNT